MKYKIKYYTIQSDHLLAIPEYSHSEIVQCSNRSKLKQYIESQKCDNDYYRKKKKFGFDYISNSGAVKVEPYIEPEIKIIR